MSDLPKRLRIKAGMIKFGERIAWGSDTAIMEEAADVIEALLASTGQEVKCESDNSAMHDDYAALEAERDKLYSILRKVLSTHDYHTDDGEAASDEAHEALAAHKATIQCRAAQLESERDALVVEPGAIKGQEVGK